MVNVSLLVVGISSNEILKLYVTCHKQTHSYKPLAEGCFGILLESKMMELSTIELTVYALDELCASKYGFVCM